MHRTRSASAWACSASATPSPAPTPSSRAGQAPRGPDITSAGILVGDPEAPADAAPTSGNLLAGNTVIGQDGDGIHVTTIAQDTTLHRNLTNRNTADGIHAENAATTLRDNEADRNGAFGIEAIAGVTDAGGNRAHGNGNPTQCSGVVCG